MWLLLVAAAVAGPSESRFAATARGATTTIYVVRHAEKARGQGADPSLTEVGERRAAALAEKLADVSFDVIFATRFKRTQETVEPIAQAQGVDIVVANDPPKVMARRLVKRFHGKSVLIAGHSTSLPRLLRALGVRERIVVREKDYGELWVVRIDATGESRLERRRFGE